MHALIPLLFIFILFNSEQLKNDKLYRTNIFALVGISYFCVLQYTFYWYRVFPTESVLQYIPGLFAVLAAIGVALSPWNRQSHPIKTLALGGLFAILLTCTHAFDTAIKEKLAELGGFFQRDTTLKPHKVPGDDRTAVEVPAIGMRFFIPAHWQRRQLPSGHTYFVHEEAGKILLEIRPNCLETLIIDTPTYMSNLLRSFEADTAVQHQQQCAIQAQVKHCLVQVKYPPVSPVKEKWHWLEIPEDKSRSYAMDFVLLQDTPELRAEIWDAISRVEILKQKATEPCRTPAAWL